jgi:son of sevenless-like protein
LQTSSPNRRPVSLIPRRIALLDIDPLELARQLTIKESEFFVKLNPREWIVRSNDLSNRALNHVKSIHKTANKVMFCLSLILLGDLFYFLDR